MTTTYVGPADSPKDEVRFYIQDTNTAASLFTDEEIQFLLDTYGPNYSLPALAVAAICADVLIAKFIKTAGKSSISADGVSIGYTDPVARYQALAAELRDQYSRIAGIGVEPYSGGIDIFEIPDFTVKPKQFGIGMDDNPSAGDQALSRRVPTFGDGWEW